MARSTSVNVGVNFVPDTSQIDKALKNINKLDVQTSITGISGDVMAPFQQSVNDLNKAMSQGQGEKEITQLMNNVKTAADNARASLEAATAGIQAFFEGTPNQANLQALKEIETRLKSAYAELEKWNKNKKAYQEVFTSASSEGIEVSGVARARTRRLQELESERESQGKLNELQQKEVEYLQEANRLANELRQTRKADIETNIKSLEGQKTNLAGSTLTEEGYNEYVTSAARATSNITSQEQGLMAAVPQYTQDMKEFTKQSNEAKGAALELGSVLTQSILGFSIANVLQSGISGAISFFKEYDATLTRTQMVTGMTREEVLDLTDSYSELADELSTTISAVAEAQLVFYQQGLSTQEALQMTEASIAIAKTGGIEAAEAADRLTAAVNGYQLSASQAMDVADKMSALDAAAASSVDELTVAMQKSASQANAAGLSLDYYMAYLSTMQEVTREAPENIGTAMKSIASRIQEISDLGAVEEDGTTFSNVATALNAVGISALDSSGQLRSLQEILDELGPMWENLDRNHQAYIATILAGNRQQSRFIALMDNYDRAMELVDVSQNASGESARQLRAYNEGLEASLTNLQNAWQKLATSFGDSSIIKTLIDGFTGVIEFINELPDGVIQLAAFVALISTVAKTINALKQPDFQNWFSRTGIGIFVTGWKSVGKASDDAAENAEKKWTGVIERLGQKLATLWAQFTGKNIEINTDSSSTDQQVKTLEKLNDATDASIAKTQQLVASQGENALSTAANAKNAALLQTTVASVAAGYNDSKEAIDAQKKSMDDNDASVNQEIAEQSSLSQTQSLQSELADVDRELNSYRSERNSIVESYNNIIQSYRQAYEEAIKPENLEAEGRRRLEVQGWSSSEQLSIFDDGSSSDRQLEYQKALEQAMSEYRKQLGDGYHQILQEVKAQRTNELKSINAKSKKAGTRKGNILNELNKVQQEATQKIDETVTNAANDTVQEISSTATTTATGTATNIQTEINKVGQATSQKTKQAVSDVTNKAQQEVNATATTTTTGGVDAQAQMAEVEEAANKKAKEVVEKVTDNAVQEINSTDTGTSTGTGTGTSSSTGLSSFFSKIWNSSDTSKSTLSRFKQTGDYSVSAISSLFSSQDLGIGQKIAGLASGINVSGGLIAKSLTQIGTSFLGLDDDASSAISNTVGLTTALAGVAPPFGAIVGASLGIITSVIDGLIVTSDEAKETIEELNTELDSLAQEQSDLSDALDTYKEIHSNLTRTESEQEELNSAVDTLADMLPNAVIAYDDMGNAIINVAAVQTELNSLAEENLRTLKEQIEAINDLQDAEDGWGILISEDDQIAARIDVVEDYQSEITDYFTALRESYTTGMEDTEATLFNNIATGFQNMLYERMTTTDADRFLWVEDAAEIYEDLLDNLELIDISEMEKIVSQLEYVFDYGDKTLAEAGDLARSKLMDMLTAAGYDAEEIEQVINVIIDYSMDGGGDLLTTLLNIDSEIAELEAIDEDDRTAAQEQRLKDLKNMRTEVMNLTSTELEALETIGALDSSLYDFVISNYGSYKELANSLIDANGEIIVWSENLELVNAIQKDIAEYQEKIAQNQEKIASGNVTLPTDEEILAKVKEMRPEWNWNYEDATMADYLSDIINSNGMNLDWEEFYFAFLRESFPSLSDEAIQKNVDEGYNKTNALETYEVYKALNGEVEEYSEMLDALETKSALENMKELLSYSPDPPDFSDMASSIDEAVDSMSTLVDLLEELDENGGNLTADNVSSIFTMLDELEEASASGYIDAQLWNASMSTLANSFSVVNGQMTMSAEGREALLALQEESIRATYREQVAVLEEAQAEVMTQKQILEAQLVALQAELENLETSNQENYDASESKANMSQSVTEYLAKQQWYQVKNTETSLNEQLELYASFFSQLEAMWTTGDYTWSEIIADGDTYNALMSSFEERWDSIFTDDIDETINNVKNEISNLEGAIGSLQEQWDSLEVRKTLAEYMASADTDLASFLSGSSDASESVDEYNEKLERTLTLLEKIEGLQHKIDENDTFRDLYEGYDGTRRGELLAENLRLYQEQYQVYLDLFEMQQEMVDQAAGDLLDSIYGELFTISENGDIGWASDEMYYKYKGMTDDMQEEIDELVEKFQEQRDALRDTETELTNYASAIKDAREEILDLIEETEDLILETLMNREEVLHNARVAALEAEIEMIEEAVEARQKARDDEEDASDLYEAQEALRRATLDSSGKNNATLLQLQQDLEDKQKEISEKRFEEDMDNRTEYLQAIIDAENETYDYRLETMTWYWEQVELMMEQSTETIMDFLMTWNEEYLQESQTGQIVLMEQWQATFDELNAIMTDEMTSNIEELKSMFLDVASSVEAIDVQVQALAGSWESVYESATKAASVTSSSGSTSTSSSGGSSSSAPKYYTSYTGSSGQYVNSDALTNGVIDESKVFTSVTDNYGNYYMPNNVSGSKLSKTGVTAGQLGITYNSSGVDVSSQAVWKSAAGDYYIWNGTAGKYDRVRSLFTNYGNNGFGSLFCDINDNVYYSLYSGSKTVPTTSEIQQALKALGASVYAQGGIVDYTGPAWVDGSTTKPEAFLSAYQTEQIGALASALDTSGVNSVSESSSVSFGTISFNVASMSSAEDGKKALDAFVKGANEMMAKKGISTALNLNYK